MREETRRRFHITYFVIVQLILMEDGTCRQILVNIFNIIYYKNTNREAEWHD
jgi:hypothetical protein